VQRLDVLAISTGAPSRLLALARQASPGQPNTDTLDLAALKDCLEYFTRPRRQPVPPAGYPPADYPPADYPPADYPPAGNVVRSAVPVDRLAPNTAEDRNPEQRCGPLESRMRAAQITDPSMLLRAAAIDRAGNELFNNAAKLAAQDTATQPKAEAARQISSRRPSRHQTQTRSRQP
jgi:hypothetical protein